METERAIETREAVKEIPDMAAFVEEWDCDSFFSSGFLNKFDQIMCNLPGNVENFEEYPFSIFMCLWLIQLYLLLSSLQNLHLRSKFSKFATGSLQLEIIQEGPVVEK